LIEGAYGEPFETVPEMLREDSDEAVAEAMSKASLGKYNTLNFERGYSFRSGQWDEEIHIPTRLGDETHTIYLARSANGKLVPLKEGRFPWDLSSIHLSRRKLDDISPAIREKYQGQLDELIQSENRLSR
jgi:CRISPR-associated endonuclease/helicase Cas3